MGPLFIHDYLSPRSARECNILGEAPEMACHFQTSGASFFNSSAIMATTPRPRNASVFLMRVPTRDDRKRPRIRHTDSPKRAFAWHDWAGCALVIVLPNNRRNASGVHTRHFHDFLIIQRGHQAHRTIFRRLFESQRPCRSAVENTKRLVHFRK